MARRTLLATSLVLLVILTAAACGGDDDGSPPAEADGGAATAGDATAGGSVFADAGCGSCHTFAAAGSSGSAGPNLDEVGPSFEVVVQKVTEGGSGMPSFSGQLSESEIRDVAAFVSSDTGS